MKKIGKFKIKGKERTVYKIKKNNTCYSVNEK